MMKTLYSYHNANARTTLRITVGKHTNGFHAQHGIKFTRKGKDAWTNIHRRLVWWYWGKDAYFVRIDYTG